MPHRPIEHMEGGYLVRNSQVYIDPMHPVPCAIITHAHGDHAAPGHERVYCHPHTAAILKKRFTYPARHIIPIEYGQPFQIDDISFSLHPAGHILGSSQIRWVQNEKVIVFTGDYKTEADPTCQSFEFLRCDVLITEVTFGRKEHQHPPVEEALSGIGTISDCNLLIGAYSLGKAQRMTYLLNQYYPDWRVMIHTSMVQYHKIYEQCGYPPGKWEPYRREVFKREKKIAYLVPPQTLLNFHRAHHYVKALATGWKEKGGKFDLLLPVSDHADWPALLKTIRASGAKEVWLVHGEGEEMLEELKRQSINVNIL